jgi:HK97 gp10 family phage protein
MKITFSTNGGLAQLLDTKVKYIQRALKDGLENIVSVGAFPIENEAKALAPVKTGTLMRSIHTEIEVASPTRATAKIGPSVPYGARLEYGFVGTDSLGRHYNQGPHPYMRPAFESKKQESLDEMKSMTKEFLVEAVDNAFSISAAKARARR